MAKDKPDGLLVVIEGIDGAGKSTLQARLAEALREQGRTVVTTKEPTDGPLGQKIRKLAAEGRDAASPEEELRLFHEDRKLHVEDVVRPALERGDVVIQDRSYFSTIAYQSERGLDRDRLRAMSEAIAPRPDVLLIVDLPAEVALERIQRTRGASDDFETLESLKRIRSIFLGFSEGVRLDGTASPDAVFTEALKAVQRPRSMGPPT